VLGPEADRAREERVRRVARAEVEDLRALEEEGALLGIEEGRPAEVELLLVRLRLREVGVDGEVRFDRGREPVAEVEARLAEERGPRRLPAPVRRGGGVWSQLPERTGAEHREAGELTRLRDAPERVRPLPS